jgi:hypothetical protein
MSDLLSRAAELFVAPAAPAVEPLGAVPPRFAPRALVLGSREEAPPVASALGNELRRANRWPAALVAIWSPLPAEASSSLELDLDPTNRCAAHGPSGAAGHARLEAADEADRSVRGRGEDVDGAWEGSLGGALPRGEGVAAPAHAAARRLAARLAARGIPASPRGRLAWLRLPADPRTGIAMAERAAAAIDVPAVLALAGPRPAAADPLLAEHDLIVLVTDDEAAPLASLALDRLAGLGPPAVAVRPLRGASRRLALAGAGRLRGAGDALRDAVRGVA